MPNTKSAAKRLKSSIQRRMNNRVRKSRVKTSEAKLLAKVTAGDKEGALALLSSAFSELDKAAKAGAIHGKKADRKKQRLHARILQMP